MTSRLALNAIAVTSIALISHSGSSLSGAGPKLALAPDRITQGALLIRDTDGRPKLECPLKHTGVRADITGFLARVTVTQDFENTAGDKVEGVYVFPLPHNAAVDDMTLQVGDRTVKGLIKRRQEAQAIYDAAKSAGEVAALLDQERPNIFTQSVANIAPGAKVRIIISYVERLPYEAGTYEFAFPMVVGPRYIPMTPSIDNRGPVDSKTAPEPGGGWKYDTARVPDAARITPPVARPDQRAGHTISLEVRLDAGMAIDNLVSKSHEVTMERSGTSQATVRLRDQASIPNKDFVLRYDAAGKKIADAVLTHRDTKGGFFTLILQPPARVASQDVTPKEIVFVLDTSGSMSGFPIEKAKESMNMALTSLNPQDTFNLITFAGDTSILFPQPVPASPENLSRARQFLATRNGSGGTEMMKAIRAALDGSGSQKHLRVVCFMTDGYVGNEPEIISEIQRHPNARVFSFGIGSSVNRYLLDKMAESGRGEVEYVSLRDDGSAAAKRFHERIRNPLLTDISVEWNGMPVTDILPSRIPDLFSAKPLVITGRYTGPAKGNIRLRGKLAGSPISREIPVDLPASEPRHPVLATLWARTKVDVLMHQPGQQEEVTRLGLDYKLMTPYTSFVAVEETVITDGGQSRRVQVPVEIPEGVSYEGTFGAGDRSQAIAFAPTGMRMAKTAPNAGWIGGGVVGGVPQAMPAPAVATDRMEERSASYRGSSGVKLDPALANRTGSAKVNVQVFLSRIDAVTLGALKQAGLEILAQPKSARMVIGRIEAGKLLSLSKLDAVRWIAPGM